MSIKFRAGFSQYGSGQIMEFGPTLFSWSLMVTYCEKHGEQKVWEQFVTVKERAVGMQSSMQMKQDVKGVNPGYVSGAGGGTMSEMAREDVAVTLSRVD